MTYKDNDRQNNPDLDVTKPKHQFQYLRELAIRLTRNTKVKVSTLFGIVLGTLTGTVFIYEQFLVPHLKSEVEESRVDIKKLKIQNEVLYNEKNSLSKSYLQSKRTSKTPILIYPVNKKNIIGRHTIFKWDYSQNKDPGFHNLVLELIKIVDGKLEVSHYQIPASATKTEVVLDTKTGNEIETGIKSMPFQFPEHFSGDFFWRIGTGELLNDKKGTRLWSRFGSFSLYPTIIDKIKDKKELTIGTTLKYLSFNKPNNCLGDPIDFDIEFARWIIDILKNKLSMKDDIKLIIRYNKFEDLFTNVINGNLDFAISDITKTEKRRLKYPGLDFTGTYRDNKQILISHIDKKNKKNEKDILNDLRNKDVTVGAQKSTVNLKAAEYLSDKYGFEVSADYSSFLNVLEAVYEKKIDYGIIDSLLWESISYPDLKRHNIELKPLIMELYKELGIEDGNEKYAIAVSGKASNKEFTDLLNEIIKKGKEKGKEEETSKLKELDNKYSSMKSQIFTKSKCNTGRDKEWEHIADAINKVSPTAAFEIRKIFNEKHKQRSDVIVQDIKRKLNILGYHIKPDNETNTFSDVITKQYIDAVIEFQEKMEMVLIDGIVGPYTKGLIDKEISNKNRKKK